MTETETMCAYCGDDTNEDGAPFLTVDGKPYCSEKCAEIAAEDALACETCGEAPKLEGLNECYWCNRERVMDDAADRRLG